jgi:hypothetical protein
LGISSLKKIAQGGKIMSKARDTKKEGKKKPAKSLKEKREEKKLKKGGKVPPLAGPA